MGEAAFDAAAGHPAGEGLGVVLAAFGVFGGVERRAAKLRGPHHERVGEHPALFQVGEQAGDGLVHVARERGVLLHVAVRVPVSRGTGIDQLDETHAALGEPAGDEALPGEAFGAAALQSVELVDVVAFTREIEGLRRGGLHGKGGLEGADARGELRVVAAAGEVAAVEGLRDAEFHFLHLGIGDAAADIRHGIGAGDDVAALMAAGQKVARPELRAAIRQGGRDDHEAGQVRVFRPEAVADPRAHARAREGHRAGVDAERGLRVVGVVGEHGADEAEIVGALGDLGKQLADPQAGLPALLEFPVGLFEKLHLAPVLLREGVEHFLRHLIGRVVVGDELRFVVEGIHMRDAAAHVEKDHALGARREMRGLGRERIVGRGRCGEQLRKDAGEHERAAEERADGGAAVHLEDGIEVHERHEKHERREDGGKSRSVLFVSFRVFRGLFILGSRFMLQSR